MDALNWEENQGGNENAHNKIKNVNIAKTIKRFNQKNTKMETFAFNSHDNTSKWKCYKECSLRKEEKIA